MKKQFALLLSLFFVSFIYSQKIIENPKTGTSTAPYLSIKKIEITDSETIVSFELSERPGMGIFIPKGSYIKDVKAEEKLFVKGADGIALEQSIQVPESGSLSYRLIFDKLNPKTEKIEFGEANEGGSWFIFDIELKDLPHPYGINKELEGNWFNNQNAAWEIGFYDNKAVYKSRVWDYDAVALKKGNGTVTLTDGNQKVTLFVKKGKKGSYSIGENPKALTVCSNTTDNLVVKSRENDEPYELPILKHDTTVYSGFIKNYGPKADFKTIAIHVDDIITGEQNNHVATIDDKGFFSVQIPLYYPHEVWVRSPVFNGSVYLEPGKNVFQLLGDKQSLYMGESAKLNFDLDKFKNETYSDYGDMMSKILDMKPGDYKVYCQDAANKKYQKLETLRESNVIGAKAYQIGKLEIEYNTISSLMAYQRNKEMAYRKKNNIPWEQREINFKSDTLTADYYDFINDAVFNNQLAVISTNGYQGAINRLQFLDLNESENLSVTMFELADELKKRNYSFTKEEQEVLDYIKVVEDFQNSPEQKAFNEKYGEKLSAFVEKHQKVIQEIAKADSFDLDKLEKYLLKNNIPISKEEKEMLAANKKLQKSESSKKLKQYSTSENDFAGFYDKHNAILNYLFSEKRTNYRNEKLAELFGIKPGFATDIITSIGIYNKVVEQLTPLSEEDLILVQKKIKIPFVSDFLKKWNDQTITKLEANKKLGGYVVNEVPKSVGDELFANIMKKYEGKVVYVDFWATWCGPCRSGIKEIASLKEEMKDKDVAFVYLTNQSSPEGTWSGMIPNIKGEHYRLSTDEWNYLSSKFNITGIPHYVLVNKKGEVVNPKLGFMSNESIKKVIEEQM